MMGIALYELANAREILNEWLTESDGEVTPELAELLDGITGDIDEKIERVALYIREQLATSTAIKEEADRLTARAKVREKAADGLKAYLKVQLERLGRTKVEGLLATVAVQRNSAPAIRTVLEASELYAIEDARPFVKREEMVVYSIDRAAVIAAWKNKEPLPSTIAVDLGTHVRIR